MRTAQLDGAHVEYFRGIANPIGVKVGAAMSAEWLQGLVTALNPQNQPGRLTFIHRFGVKDIEQRLPADDRGGARHRLAGAVGVRSRCTATPRPRRAASRPGASTTSWARSKSAFRIHEELGSSLGGVHIELTGEDVTECIGGARGLTEADLARAYRSQVDPRLNPSRRSSSPC